MDKEQFALMDLYAKPASYKFNEEEIALIKKHDNIKNYLVYYAFYRKTSNKNCYIEFIIDCIPNHRRRSGVMNNWEIHTKRALNRIEYKEMIENFGTAHKRFIVWNYETIEHLIEEDAKYGIVTPQVFIDECKKRGYYDKSNQLKLEL